MLNVPLRPQSGLSGTFVEKNRLANQPVVKPRINLA